MKSSFIPVLLLFLLAVRLDAAPLLDAQLLSATEKGDIKTAQLLVRRGAHVNARNQRKQTPLMLAAMHSDERLVHFLLAKSADVKTRDDSGFSVLGYGPRFVDLLLACGAKATPGDREALSDWLENAIWIDSDIEDEDVKTEARALLRVGMNLNASGFDETGTTPLLNALDSRPSFVSFLLSLGADPNVADKMVKTPLMAAISPLISAEDNGDSLPLLLLKHGARVTARDSNGETALLLAAQANRLTLAKTMIRRGANPNIADKRGETALMRAARGGFPDMARLLLASGADKRLKNAAGQTALDYAKSREFVFQGWFNGNATRHIGKQQEQEQEQELEHALRAHMEVQAILEGKAK